LAAIRVLASFKAEPNALEHVRKPFSTLVVIRWPGRRESWHGKAPEPLVGDGNPRGISSVQAPIYERKYAIDEDIVEPRQDALGKGVNVIEGRQSARQDERGYERHEPLAVPIEIVELE
jgi:hypothetical protein